MRIRTDDEVYRVDAVWLGPPKATFPWRARYVAWGVGLLVFLVVLAAERRMNIGFGFFSTAWAVVITIVITRIITSKITHERPLGAVLTMWMRELTAPREKTSGTGGAAGAARLKVRSRRPMPKQKRGDGPRPGQRQKSRQPSRQQQSRAKSAQRSRQQSRQKSQRSAESARGTVPTRRTRSKEVRGVRSPARP
ncbi:hypothetical protein GCM10009854_28300 [Saccharopolyspora halophila]|uniref:DUF3043 domain-containing protein n=1 Tax=Saccharopolyspora halophila TaxID=405551 RepID=A0ABN3GDE8_9PSEU